MLPQDGDWRFRCESDHAKRFEKLWLQPLGLTHQLKQWDELVNWLSFCMAVFGLLGFWAQTLKEFNVLQLKKDSMQGQFVSTWSQDESRPKASKSMMEMEYGPTQGYAGFCIVQNQCQSIKLKGTELDALNSIALSGHARAADPGQLCVCVFFVSLSDIKQPSQGIRDWFGEEKEVSRPSSATVSLPCRTVSWCVVCNLLHQHGFLETHGSLEFENRYLIKVCWCKGREDNQANKIVEDHALLLPPQLM